MDQSANNRCAGPSRRAFLQVGAAGMLGLTLDGLLRSRAAFAAPGGGGAAAADAVINIFLPGGMAAQETFDPKPLAPLEYRGNAKTTKTAIPGVHFADRLSRIARIADKITVVRSMTHGEADHDRGVHNMLTGYRPSPALIYPSFGSVVSHELGGRKKLPPYMCIPRKPHDYAGSGYLSGSHAPFSLGSDPSRSSFKVRDLERPKSVDEARFDRRKSLLEIVNRFFDAREASGELDVLDDFYKQAYGMISSPSAREAFAISKESKKLRDAYGRNTAGQRMLLARRLVERGVRFVSLTYSNWDMHDNIDRSMRSRLPSFDRAFATLIADLDSRGMLDRTLVLVTTEFGRTPKINRTGGRDHWPKVFSVVMAGGGIKRGLIYGSSDATSTAPQDDALTVEDWAATIYHVLGIDPEKRLMSPGDRPVRLVDGGTPRRELLA